MRKAIPLVIVGLLILGTYVLWQVANSRAFQLFGEIIPRVSTTEMVVALTFDDGPSAKTGEILSILQESGVKATFFVIGNELEQNIKAGQQIAAVDTN